MHCHAKPEIREIVTSNYAGTATRRGLSETVYRDKDGSCVDLRHSRPALRQVEHLSRVEQPVELVQQLGALVAAALRVDEDEQRLRLRRRYRLDDEDLARRGRRRRRRRWTGVDGQRSAVAARAAAAAAAAVALLHRRFPATSNRRLERTLHDHPANVVKFALTRDMFI